MSKRLRFMDVPIDEMDEWLVALVREELDKWWEEKRQPHFLEEEIHRVFEKLPGRAILDAVGLPRDADLGKTARPQNPAGGKK